MKELYQGLFFLSTVVFKNETFYKITIISIDKRIHFDKI